MEPVLCTRPFKDFTSPRMKRKMSQVSENEKIMIVNVYKYVLESWPIDKYRSKQSMKYKTADILGIGKSTLYRVLKEYVMKSGTAKAPAPPENQLNNTKEEATLQCRSCQDYIRGFQYICVQCLDFVICGTCEAKSVHPEHYVLRVPSPQPNDEVQTVLKQIRLKLFPETNTSSEDSDDEEEIKIEAKQEFTNQEERSYCMSNVSDDTISQESRLVDQIAADVAQVPVNINSEFPSLVIKEEPIPILNTIYMGQWEKESNMARDSEMFSGRVAEVFQSNVSTSNSTSRNANKRDSAVVIGTSAVCQLTATTSRESSSIASKSGAGVTTSADTSCRPGSEVGTWWSSGATAIQDTEERVPFKIKRED